jgi:hypothetical protein
MDRLEELRRLTALLSRKRRGTLIIACVLCFGLGTFFGMWLVFQKGVVISINSVETVAEKPGIKL